MSAILEKADQLRRQGHCAEAIEAYRDAAAGAEVVDAALCLKLAQCHERLGQPDRASRWALRVVDAADSAFTEWQTAAKLIARCGTEGLELRRRGVRLALLSSYTTSQFAPLLSLAALRLGVGLDIFETAYGQYRQAIIDEHSDLYAWQPHAVLLAVHEGDLQLPGFSASPAEEVEHEVERWASLWQLLGQRSGARVIQHNFALAADRSMGHLETRVPGSRYAMARLLNLRLGEAAGDAVALVDCEQLSSLYGKMRWFDPRWWHLAKHALAPDAQPLLAKHTAAVLAADLGLSRKCLVLDLDNTLWGGIIGEDGLDGIRLGGGAEGEAYAAFQDYVLDLKAKGVVLAVCSKNDEAAARKPFESHPEMKLRLDDIAVFVANWRSKVENLREIATRLNLGLDALVFVDDSQAEREAVRQLLPEVEVIALPEDPALYVRALTQSSMLETASFTAEDSQRTEQYRARAEIAELSASSASLEDFYRSLRMRATLGPFDEVHLPRIAQLIGKTNQFNLTTRRHSLGQLKRFVEDPDCVHFYLRLTDRFADHGLVGVLIAFRRGDVLDVDTWLMSCRVIGRTVEQEMAARLCVEAAARGCTAIRGTYVPTAKNGMVEGLFAKLGFEQSGAGEEEGSITWLYDLRKHAAIENEFIDSVWVSEGEKHGSARSA